MHKELAGIINQIFREHSSIEKLKAGILFPLNKMKGDKVAKNTRPVVFLVALRKILSTIVLRRIEAAVEGFLSIYQHAYRRGRSTTEAVWTWQWVRGMIERYSERVKFLGLDLSKAFDSLNRSKLMEILGRYNLATEDELRMIQFLLSKTTLRGKINGELGKTFDTHIGTPQGDALSPILFLIYLEHVWRTFPGRNLLLSAPDVVVKYADDVNLALRETRQEREERESRTSRWMTVPAQTAVAVALSKVLTFILRNIIYRSTWRRRYWGRSHRESVTLGESFWEYHSMLRWSSSEGKVKRRRRSISCTTCG